MEEQVGIGDKSKPFNKGSLIRFLTAKRKKVLISTVGVFSILLVAVLGYFFFKNIESRKIPASWATYKNTYYGYSFRYSSEVIVEPDIYGLKDGEDLGVELHVLDTEKLKNIGIKDQEQYLRASEFRRGVLLDSSYDKWNVQIAKPELDRANVNKCRRDKTNGGLPYYECVTKDRVWSFFIYLTSQPADNAFLTIRFDKPRDSFSQEDRLAIKRIINSFFKESQMSMLIYPTKSDLFQWVKTNWCDGKNKLYEEYANGLKQYARYSVLSTSKVLDTVYLTKPKSFCEVPVSSMPQLPIELCPFPNSSQTFDNHALGESKQYAVCGGSIPSNSYEYSCDGITSLLQIEISKASTPKGWKYSVMTNGNAAVAVPVGWRTQEDPIGSCNPDSIMFIDPNKEMLLTLGRDSMTTVNTVPEGAVNLGKIECGLYADCELIREGADSQYEYQLLLKGQPNIIAIPRKISIKFLNNKNQAKLLLQIDKITKSMIFLYENEVD